MRQGEATREAGERGYESVAFVAPPPVRVSQPAAIARPSTSLGMNGGGMTAAAPQQPAKTRVAVLEIAETTPSPALLTSAMRELRASIRGRPLPELAEGIGASVEETLKVCSALMAQGQVVRRGLKYFVA